MTIDELATEAGTTTRHVRSLQTMGLLARPALRARTGLYGKDHLARLSAVLRLQDQGFSLRSLSFLFAALDKGESLATVLASSPTDGQTGTGTGSAEGAESAHDALGRSGDSAELYGFTALERRQPRGRRPLLWVVPTTMCGKDPASGVA
jgi:DNA-binding transcriptional MerR regulator